MNHLTMLQTNIKGMRSLTFNHPVVLLSGDNGSGKTAVLNAIELAMTGAARDLAGRDDVKLAATLRLLAPSDAAEVFALAQTSSGGENSWRLAVSGGSAKRKGSAVADMPFQALLDGVYSSKSKLLTTLVDLFGLESFPAFNVEQLPASFVEIAGAFAAQFGELDSLQAFLNTYAALKTDQRATDAELKKIDTVLDYLRPMLHPTRGSELAQAASDLLGAALVLDPATTTCPACGQKGAKGLEVRRAQWAGRMQKPSGIPRAVLIDIEAQQKNLLSRKEAVKVGLDAMDAHLEAAVASEVWKIRDAAAPFLKGTGFTEVTFDMEAGRIGLDGIFALSGAEQTLCLLAIAAAYGVKHSRSLNLVLLPDRNYSLRMLAHFARIAMKGNLNLFVATTFDAETMAGLPASAELVMFERVKKA